MFYTGYCGFILVRGTDGSYIRRTWGEKSHRACPGTVLHHECMCDCHIGLEPWKDNGEWEGHRAIVLEPIEVTQPMKPRFTPVNRSEKQPRFPRLRKPTRVVKPAESLGTSISAMEEALRSIESDEEE